MWLEQCSFVEFFLMVDGEPCLLYPLRNPCFQSGLYKWMNCHQMEIYAVPVLCSHCWGISLHSTLLGIGTLKLCFPLLMCLLLVQPPNFSFCHTTGILFNVFTPDWGQRDRYCTVPRIHLLMSHKRQIRTRRNKEEGNMAYFSFCTVIHKISFKKILVLAHN